jgi:hypothetical protein
MNLKALGAENLLKARFLLTQHFRIEPIHHWSIQWNSSIHGIRGNFSFSSLGSEGWNPQSMFWLIAKLVVNQREKKNRI